MIRICVILIRIRILGSGSGSKSWSCPCTWLSRCRRKIVCFPYFFAYLYRLLYIYFSLQRKQVLKKSKTVALKVFFYLWLFDGRIQIWSRSYRYFRVRSFLSDSDPDSTTHHHIKYGTCWFTVGTVLVQAWRRRLSTSCRRRPPSSHRRGRRGARPSQRSVSTHLSFNPCLH